MKTSLRLRLALGFALVASLTPVAASPAAAADGAPSCSTLVHTTPGIEADLDGDGYPDWRAPRIYDVTLCSDSYASYVTYPPTGENCRVGKLPTCYAVRISVLPAHVWAGASAELCYSIEGGGRSCEGIETPPWAYTPPQTICIGYDLEGGHPCSGGTVFAFE